MNMDDAPDRLPPKLHFYLLIIIVFSLFSAWSFSGSGFSVSKLIESPEYLMDFLKRAFPPFSEHRITWDAFFRYLDALLETIQMAFAGTALGVIFGFVLALLASRNLLFTSPYLRPIEIFSKGLIVYSAPGVTSGPISGGNSEISGAFDLNEAIDLANVLRAGKLPASADIVQADEVGPSLGQEAIESGTNSFMIALILVLVWMMFYYGKVGLYSNIALVLNIVLIFGILSGLGAVLT